MDNNSDVPSMVNMDSANPIPGGISIEQRKAMDLDAVAKRSEEFSESIAKTPTAVQPAPTIFSDPEAVVEPHPVVEPPIHVNPSRIEEAISMQRVQNDPQRETRQPEETSILTPPVEPITRFEPETVPQAVEATSSEESVEKIPTSEVQESTSSPESEEFKKSDECIPESTNEDNSITQEYDSNEIESSDGIQVAEVDIPDSPTAEAVIPEANDAIDDVPDNDDGFFVAGITDEEADRQAQSKPGLNFHVGPKKLEGQELIDIQDFATTHYRIVEGINPELAKLKGTVDVSSVKIIEYADKSDFDLQKVRIDRATNDGERRVQIVAVQSGYHAMVRPMRSRELRTFGRELRNSDTYSYRMGIASSVYSKMCEFSCGPMTFDQFVNQTAYPDLQTLIFGLYHATFPTVNNFNISCTNPKCSNTFSVPIGNNTLVCIPPGSVTQEQIRRIVYNHEDPKQLIEASQRFKGIDIFISKGVKFFRVRTPSIAEFTERAYRNKKQDVIDDNLADMAYSGYIRGVGKLDIEKYNKTGVAEYYYDTRIESVDREIAMLDPDEKESFEAAILKYMNKYAVSYQIPRVKCPHCGKIMQQRELNMETLFFEIRNQKIGYA